MPGMHGIAAATYAFQESDAILAVGVRFDERVLSTVMSEWAPAPRSSTSTSNPAEISKNRAAHIGIAGQAAPALAALAEAYRGPARAPRRRPPRGLGGRRSRRGSASTRTTVDADADDDPAPAGDPGGLPHHPRRGDHLHRRRPAPDVGRPALPLRPAAALDHLGRASGRWASACRRRSAPRWPCPTSWSSTIAGDGSFEMTLQELSTAQMYGLPVKVVILNNGYLGMVRQWQELFWEGRYAGHQLRGLPAELRGHRPGLRHPRPRPCTTPATWRTRWPRRFAADGPALVDVHVNPMAKVFPMVPQGKGPGAIIVGGPAAGASA